MYNENYTIFFQLKKKTLTHAAAWTNIKHAKEINKRNPIKRTIQYMFWYIKFLEKIWIF